MSAVVNLHHNRMTDCCSLFNSVINLQTQPCIEWRFDLVVTSLGTSMKLRYIKPG